MQPMNLLVLLLSLSLLCCKKSDNAEKPPAENLPTVQLSDVTQQRKTTDVAVRFYVSVWSSFTKPITITYATQEGTAKQGTDFVATNGTLTIQPGSTQGYVDVTVKGDSLRQNDLQFYVQFSNAQNALLGGTKATATILNGDNNYLPTSNDGYVAATSYTGYSLAWSDEFNGSALDTKVWNTEQGNNNGWGNHELEYYTGRPQNVFLSSGNLIIEARKESYQGFNYTSARLTTQSKKTFTFGRMDIRAKLPVLKGMWPAIWALGSNITTVNWPECGEIDIMELVGQTPGTVYGTGHWKNSTGGHSYKGGQTALSSGDFSQNFHVFSILWEQDSIQWLMDDKPYYKATKSIVDGIYPFNNPFFFLLNVAVGGDWPGNPDGTTQFPQRMFVDYVRVYQKN
jgi:beta-glucanase (GH16 family)